jgi:putative flippase GtrA
MKLYKIASLSNNWSFEEVNKWKEKRRKGLLNFILTEGILIWGGISLSFFLIASHQSITLQRENPLIHVLETASIWLVASVFYSFSVWYCTNVSYENYISKNQSE